MTNISNGMNSPIIALGQQPNGFFPKRFFYAKLQSARNLQNEIGGKIVFFYHDSDADYRETITVMRDKNTNQEVRLNFTQENKIQKNFSPLYLKRIPVNWKSDILKQLPRFLPPHPTLSLKGRGIKGEGEKNLIDIFKNTNANNAADFCLEMYKKLGLLDGIEVVRSSDKSFREKADDLQNEFYADVPYENETVRAKILAKPLSPHAWGDVPSASEGQRGRTNENHYTAQLHHGGGKTTEFEISSEIKKEQKTPGRDNRFKWMNSVINATHYITGNSEYDYLKRDNFQEVEFIKRDQIEDQELAWLP